MYTTQWTTALFLCLGILNLGFDATFGSQFLGILAQTSLRRPKPGGNAPGSYDVFYGPFNSWLNVKNPSAAGLSIPAAVGDGITDDTAALQAALDYAGQATSPICDGVNGDLGCPAVGGPPAINNCPGFNPATDPGDRDCIPGEPKSTGPAAGWHGGTIGVVYLPAGTYKISKTLRVYNRFGIYIVGEAPQATTILWNGTNWQAANPSPAAGFDFSATTNESNIDMFLFDGGGTLSAIRRITFDGASAARVALNFGGSGSHEFGGAENSEVLDMGFQNTAYGIVAGGICGCNDADTPVKRSKFKNISRAALLTNTYNTLNWYVWDSVFENVNLPLTEDAGSIQAYNNLFINSSSGAILLVNAQPGAFRGNVSITTVDAAVNTSNTYGNQNAFIWQAFYGASDPFIVQGNLVISANANAPPSLYIGLQGPSSFVDNAFYDTGFLTTPPPGTYPISITPTTTPGWQGIDPVTGTADRDPLPRSYFFSGNIYDGEPTSTYPTRVSADPYIVVDSTVPSGYVPANSLRITQSEIQQLLRATSSSPIIQEIVDRMPQPSIRIDPSSNLVALTDLTPSMSTAAIATAISSAITNAISSKANLIHFSEGVYNLNNFTVPANLRMIILGDGNYGTRLQQAVQSTAPLITVGTGPVVSFRMDDINLYDLLPASSCTGSCTTTGFLALTSGDMVGGRVYVDYLNGSFPGPGAPASGVSMSGFNNVKARFDTVLASTLQSFGTGVQGGVVSDADSMIQTYGLMIQAKAGTSPYYAGNGGSIHVRDMYCENVMQAIDVRGGSGQLVVDNQTRYHLTPNATQPIHNFSNFNGALDILNLGTWGPVFVGMPSSYSATNIYGLLGYFDVNPADYTVSDAQDAALINAYLQTGLPTEWERQSVVDCSGLFGLTSAQAASPPSNLSIGGSSYSLSFVPSAPVGASAIVVTNQCLNLPENQPATAFTMPASALDALRYRPFSEPAAISDPLITNIILHRVGLSSNRPFGLTITNYYQ
jgi:hypothetical protein